MPYKSYPIPLCPIYFHLNPSHSLVLYIKSHSNLPLVLFYSHPISPISFTPYLILSHHIPFTPISTSCYPYPTDPTPSYTLFILIPLVLILSYQIISHTPQLKPPHPNPLPIPLHNIPYSFILIVPYPSQNLIISNTPQSQSILYPKPFPIYSILSYPNPILSHSDLIFSYPIIPIHSHLDWYPYPIPLHPISLYPNLILSHPISPYLILSHHHSHRNPYPIPSYHILFFTPIPPYSIQSLSRPI